VAFQKGAEYPRREFFRSSAGLSQDPCVEAVQNERGVLESEGNKIGQACLNSCEVVFSNSPCGFILLSEAQVTRSEGRVDIYGYPLDNVMAEEKDRQPGVRTRVGLGSSTCGTGSI
jgi:hypothetical protein